MDAPRIDVAIVGAGHNGLVAAAYLARAGLTVEAFERREIVGGACVTEELWPGVRVTACRWRCTTRTCSPPSPTADG
jgi:phytoene dehydrogenase-like protein